ncbi:MAG: hypothetical protein GY703_09380 [Gammaproteobacteria bacterium]|nr:hypothetical protein [Gammaproteobacteria bacterium]
MYRAFCILKSVARVSGKAENHGQTTPSLDPLIESSSPRQLELAEVEPLDFTPAPVSLIPDHGLPGLQQVEEQVSVQDAPAAPGGIAADSDRSTLFVILSDTDNDLASAKNTLSYIGLLKNDGELINDLSGITLIHTGDFIDKKGPDFSAVEYWLWLQEGARSRGGSVKYIAGNHEQEIWQKIRAGKVYNRNTKQTRELSEFIGSMDLFHVVGSTLFMHGYPTLEFLRVLLHFHQVTGKDLNAFNLDHYRRAFGSIDGLKQYSYTREDRKLNYLLYDLPDASRYYKKQGQKIGDILMSLGIATVVHGHRPQRSGIQMDFEFNQWIPGVRMIGNDTIVKRRGIGATVIRDVPGEELMIRFINRKAASSAQQRKIRGYFSRSGTGARGTDAA